MNHFIAVMLNIYWHCTSTAWHVFISSYKNIIHDDETLLLAEVCIILPTQIQNRRLKCRCCTYVQYSVINLFIAVEPLLNPIPQHNIYTVSNSPGLLCWDTYSCLLCQMIGRTAECIIIVTSPLSCPMYTDGEEAFTKTNTGIDESHSCVSPI